MPAGRGRAEEQAIVERQPLPSRRILVTGFAGFPGSPRNPTERVATALRREAPRLARLGIDLRCAVMPVAYDGLEERLAALAEAHRPDAWLMLGVAGRRRHLCIETLARNRASPLRPDAAGRCPSQRLAAQAPLQKRASLPVARLAAALRAAALPVRLSRDAGDYLCNAALFRALDAALAQRIGFLHMPRPRAPGGPKPRTPGMSQRPIGRESAAKFRAPPRRPAPADLTRAALLSVLVLAVPARSSRP